MSSEFDLIDAIRARLGRARDRVLLGSGDDAAITRPDGVTVTTVDGFVEGVHFRLATTSLRDLGHKCVAAATSDIAAMGALPGEIYIVLGLPDHLAGEEVIEFADGAVAVSSVLGFTICGGDISRSHELFVAITATGHAGDERELVTRDGALPGDRVGVTGTLGGAGAGLVLLERKLGGLDAATGEVLLGRQLRPWPRIETGRALAGARVHAMIDVSDGIASDCARLAERSGVLVEVELGRLPLEDGVAAVADQAGIDPLALAAGAGEDYELLLTAPGEASAGIEAAAEKTGVGITWIGRIAEGEGVRLLGEDGRERSLHGWDHLAPRPSRPGRA
jgi:thiamine-monophosphate kinase